MVTGNLYLTGFMGVGKSSVGRILAKLLGRPFVELDQLVSRRLGMGIPQAFAKQGEKAFRRAESAELAKLAAGKRLVVATGGGLPVDPANRSLMRGSGKIVFLQAGLETCGQRVGQAGRMERPLWRDEARLRSLFDSRTEAYEDCDLAVGTDDLDPGQTAESVLAALIPDTAFSASLEGGKSPVTATCHGPRAMLEFLGPGRRVLLCDRNLRRLHAKRYLDAMGEALVLSVAPGERSKSLATAKRLYQSLLDARLGRGDTLIALGGGMTTDLGAFVAATYKRGMNFALVSTSLLGCVDAAVGGKAGVNLGRAKNAVGCFTRPQAVVLDLLALGTLRRAQRAEGLVEAYKTGLALKPGLARMIEDHLEHLLGGDLIFLARVATGSAQAKAQVVELDFREGGLRKVLNLGHTYGHAVEGLSNYKLSHGASVAAGLMVAAGLSLGRGLLERRAFERIASTMAPLAPAGYHWPQAEQAWELMLNDKKNRGGKVLFVLLKGLGGFTFVEDVALPELQSAINQSKEFVHG